MIFQASDEYFAMHTEVACWLLRLKEIKKKQILLWKDLTIHINIIPHMEASFHQLYNCGSWQPCVHNCSKGHFVSCQMCK